jgi:hypothetical protein
MYQRDATPGAALALKHSNVGKIDKTGWFDRPAGSADALVIQGQ